MKPAIACTGLYAKEKHYEDGVMLLHLIAKRSRVNRSFDLWCMVRDASFLPIFGCGFCISDGLIFTAQNFDAAKMTMLVIRKECILRCNGYISQISFEMYLLLETI